MFHSVFGSGFEPYPTLFFHFGLDPDSNRYPNYSSILGVRIRIRTVFLFTSSLWFGSGFKPLSTLSFHCVFGSGFEPLSKLFFFTMRYGSGFEPFSTQASRSRVFLLTFQARAYFKPHVQIFYVIFSGPGSGFSHHCFLKCF